MTIPIPDEISGWFRIVSDHLSQAPLRSPSPSLTLRISGKAWIRFPSSPRIAGRSVIAASNANATTIAVE